MSIDDDELLAGRYRLLARINSGTLADIRLAHDELLDRDVAVKLAATIDPTGFYAPGVALKESRTAAKLEHPHLLPIYDFGSHDDCSFIVMRRFSESLRQHLARFRHPAFLSSSLIVGLLRQIASAIDYLHEHGPIVHANLKPENILLDSESGTQVHSYVSDFGVAALGMRSVGTPVYMAPEHAAAGEVTPAVDRYAFGVIAFECFTGHIPFTETSTTMLLMQKHSPPEGLFSASRYRADLPIGVDVVLDRLMRKDPVDRYATATEAINQLSQAFLSGHTAITGPVFVSYARADQAYAHALAAELRRVGVDLWLDRDIRPGTNWDRSVEDALGRCRTMLVLMSPAAAASESVRDEWSYFLEQRRDVHPFVYQACDMPLRLRRRQYATSSGDLLNDIARVVNMLSGQTSPTLPG